MKAYKTVIRQIFRDIIEAPVYNEKAIYSYFDAGYIQEVDHQKLDFDQFCQHIKAQKKRVQSIRVDFRTLISENDIVFSNHWVDVITTDGRSNQFHVLAEFHFKDGKVIYCDELTRLVKGAEQNSDLGSAH